MESQIIQGDCLEVLKTIPDETLDLVLTDPPYGDGVAYGRKDKTILTNEDETINYKFLDMVYPKLKQDKVCYLFSNWKFEQKIRNYIEQENIKRGGVYFKIRMLLIIVKNNIGMGYGFRNQYEVCLVLEKGNPKYKCNDFSNVMLMKHINHTDETHPHTKHIDVLDKMIRHSTEEGDLVFDGFLGSGSTIEACIKSKRNYIGVELDNRWFGLINERVKKWGTQETLF